MNGSVVDEGLNYEKLEHTYGTYQLTRIVQQAGGQTVPVTSTGGQESVFDIPPKVGNFSKSILSCTVAPDTGVTAGNTFILANTDGIPCIR